MVFIVNGTVIKAISTRSLLFKKAKVEFVLEALVD